MRSQTKRNNFGVLSKAYDAARRGYSKEVFQYLKKLAKGKKIKVLDIGCGTGISTRQLKEYGFNVIGVDKDLEMVKVARSKNDHIPYVVALAHKLPFKDDEFDVITAFTAFHWFTDKKSVREIKRVLKPKGLFFTAWKKPAKSKNERLRKIGRAYSAILDKYFGNKSDSARNYDPETILKRNGFKKTVTKSFYFQEKYTLSKAMLLVKSISNWNLLSNDEKPKLYRDIKNLYKKNMIKGHVIKNREVKVVIGYSPRR